VPGRTTAAKLGRHRARAAVPPAWRSVPGLSRRHRRREAGLIERGRRCRARGGPCRACQGRTAAAKPGVIERGRRCRARHAACALCAQRPRAPPVSRSGAGRLVWGGDRACTGSAPSAHASIDGAGRIDRCERAHGRCEMSGMRTLVHEGLTGIQSHVGLIGSRRRGTGMASGGRTNAADRERPFCPLRPRCDRWCPVGLLPERALTLGIRTRVGCRRGQGRRWSDGLVPHVGATGKSGPIHPRLSANGRLRQTVTFSPASTIRDSFSPTPTTSDGRDPCLLRAPLHSRGSDRGSGSVPRGSAGDERPPRRRLSDRRMVVVLLACHDRRNRRRQSSFGPTWE